MATCVEWPKAEQVQSAHHAGSDLTCCHVLAVSDGRFWEASSISTVHSILELGCVEGRIWGTHSLDGQSLNMEVETSNGDRVLKTTDQPVSTSTTGHEHPSWASHKYRIPAVTHEIQPAGSDDGPWFAATHRSPRPPYFNLEKWSILAGGTLPFFLMLLQGKMIADGISIKTEFTSNKEREYPLKFTTNKADNMSPMTILQLKPFKAVWTERDKRAG